MSMNFVGNLSILDRGDGPAQAVIDRNARSLAQRVADDTKQELEKVLGRVDNVMGSYEMSGDLYGSTNMEYVNDLNELTEILKDQVKKKKYQQQVTIFVVGFQDVCGQRLTLLKQVNEFFMENTKPPEEDDGFPQTPDLDLDDVQDSIEDSLDTAYNLTRRLGELNREIVEYLAHYAEKKASNKTTEDLAFKGKKKLEKALQQTKDEVFSLQEKLLTLQTDVEEKDEKMQALFRQLESKNFELQRFRTAAEVAKKNMQNAGALQIQIAKRDEKIQDMRQQINRLEIELTSSNHNKDRSNSRLMHASEETQHRLTELEKEVEEKKLAMEDLRRDLEKLHEGQVRSIVESHRGEIEELKRQHKEEIDKLLEELEETKHQLITEQHKAATLALEKSSTESDIVRILDFDSEPNSQDQTRESSRQESRQSLKNKSRQSSGAGKRSGTSPASKSPSRKLKSGGKQSAKTEESDDDSDDEYELDTKEYAEIAVQDEGGDHTKAIVDDREIRKGTSSKGRRSKSTLETVEEMEVLDFDLDDEASWSNIPKDQVYGQFGQYRKQCVRRIHSLEEQVQLMQAKTQRKVQTLKAQFLEHKNKWDAERKILVKQVGQASKMQTDAEKEADSAMTQLEEFINDQEKLDNEEQNLRKEMTIERTESRKDSDLQTTETESTEPDLKKLMQQTDDAKSQRGHRLDSDVLQVNQLYIHEAMLVTDSVSHDITLTVTKQTESFQQTIRPVGLLVYEEGRIHLMGLGSHHQGELTKLEMPSDSMSQINKSEVDSAIFEDETLTSEFSVSFLDDENTEQLKYEEFTEEFEISNFPKLFTSASMLDESSQTPKRISIKVSRLEPEMSIIKEEVTPSPSLPKETAQFLQVPRVILSPVLSRQPGEITLPVEPGEITLPLEPDSIQIDFVPDSEKAQELTSRATTSGALSAPPAIEEVETIDGKKPSSSKSIEHPASFVNLKEFPPLEGAASGDHSPSLHPKTSSGSTGKDSLSRDSSVRISSIESNYEESGLQTRHSEARTRSDQKSGSLKSGSAKSGSVKSVSIKSGSAKSESEKLGTAKSGSAHFGSVKSGSVKSGCEGIEEKVNISDVDKSVCSNGSVAERISSLSSRRDLVSLRKESLPSSSSVKRNSLDVKSTSEKDGVMDVETSPHSRKSLTSQYKANLKSSAISVRSLDDELILDEDDLQDADVKASNDAGTSPPIENQFQKARQTPLVDHPVVVDFVKTYDGVVQFKDLLSKILLDKDMMTASQILSDIETLEFDRHMKVLPQVEGMTYNVTYILEEIANLLNNILVYDREPNVSSLMFLSRDPTKASLTRQKSSESGRGILATRGSFQSEISMNEQRNLMSDNKHLLQDIQEKYHILHQQFDEENRKHGEQLQHNTVVMMGMQDTINELQRELSTLGNKRRTRSGTPSQRMKKPPSPETSVMFTRLDSERNAKIMKRAVMDDRLPPETYKEAVSKMDDYVSIPAQRFGHLVRKYIHHCRMKAIEDNVRKSKSLDDDVFEVLDKMEALQNERARRWANSMDEMGAERLRLANILMDTLDSIEEESGLFLIKPMYSFRGRKIPEHYGSKLSRPVRPKHRPASHASTGAFAPAPTPSQAKLIKMDIKTQQQAQDFVVNMRPLGPLEGDPTGLTGSSLSWVGQAPNQTWSFSSSQSRTLKDDGLGSYNTPRILELDINRMLIGQNNVSTVLQQPMTSDRLVNASQNSLRSYVTVNRPMVQPSHSERQQPATATRVAPPSSPQGRSGGVADKVHMIEKDHNVPSTLQYPRTPPLPPITPTHSDTGTSNSHKEPPHSPPGSSLQTSPTTKEVSDFGIDGSGKVYTRDSSHLTLTSISAISEDE